MTREQIIRRAKEARAKRVELAREDVNEFVAFVARDEETWRPLRQAPIHERMQLLADEHELFVMMTFPESGKSIQLTVLRTVWMLGNNPDLRFAIISQVQRNARKFGMLIKRYIEDSPEVAEVFPELRPGDKWEQSFFSVRRTAFSKDPSVQCLGFEMAITSSRVDVMIFDDPIDQESTATEAQRNGAFDRITKTYLDRLTARGRAMFLTNAWHPKDAAHRLSKERGWHLERVPVEDDDGNLAWAEQFPRARLDKLKRRFGSDYARAYLCKARDEGESPFDLLAIAAAFSRGARDLEMVRDVDPSELVAYPGAGIYCGVDLAHRKKSTSARTAIATTLNWPDDGSRQLLWIDSGRYSATEIARRLIDHALRYDPIFIVENNAAQEWIIDVVRLEAEAMRLRAIAAGDPSPPPVPVLRIVPFTTGRNKAHPEYGVEGLATEIGASTWVFPSGVDGPTREGLARLREAMEYYQRGEHTPDELMALWMAREGCRRGAMAGRREGEQAPGVLVIGAD